MMMQLSSIGSFKKNADASCTWSGGITSPLTYPSFLPTSWVRGRQILKEGKKND
jgi:hypothetical protein